MVSVCVLVHITPGTPEFIFIYEFAKLNNLYASKRELICTLCIFVNTFDVLFVTEQRFIGFGPLDRV